ncbi:unnamed protein product [Ambrosiozyma monospora]|uniref:Unnamed protein product n=1 Tax=Ambrosiozyma monospora TaxID=43982 RepID=A0ACB5T954_AMBMO|nr:unnamed protein product [Ambrosiozyma monospora]
MSLSQAAMVNSGSAIFAASMSTAITAPFDTIKTNMQVNPKKFNSFTKTVKILVDSGWRRLFDGVSLRLIRKAMSAGIAWGIYEELVRL